MNTYPLILKILLKIGVWYFDTYSNCASLLANLLVKSMTEHVIWERISIITTFFHAKQFAIFISYKKWFTTRHNCATHSLAYFLIFILFRAIQNMIKQHQHKNSFLRICSRWVLAFWHRSMVHAMEEDEKMTVRTHFCAIFMLKHF